MPVIIKYCMDRLFEDIKNNYKTINIVVFSICIYLIVFLNLSNTIGNILPSLTKCPYLVFTGKSCPLCGGTRFFLNIKNALYDITYLFNFFGIVFIFFIYEIFFRGTNLLKHKYSNKLIKLDIILHMLVFILYIIYATIFIIQQ